MNTNICTVVPTADLSAELAFELFALAAEAAGPSFDRTDLERRLALYPSVAIVRDHLGLAAFALLDVRRRGIELVYLGPLFSRRGAYVALFAGCIERWLDSGEPFCMGVEIENPLVRDVLSVLLLPTSAYPRPGDPASEVVRALARIFGAEFPHLAGLDDRTMTTAADGARRRGFASGRSQLALVPCTSPAARQALRAELARGVESLGAMRRIGLRKEPTRERDLLRTGL